MAVAVWVAGGVVVEGNRTLVLAEIERLIVSIDGVSNPFAAVGYAKKVMALMVSLLWSYEGEIAKLKEQKNDVMPTG